MNGAREYANIFESGQYGKLRIVSGKHARGKYFHIYVNDKGNEVEVYGILGGHPGWTEYYGWKHSGPWQEDFADLVLKATKERKSQIKARKMQEAAQEEESRRRTGNILANY